MPHADAFAQEVTLDWHAVGPPNLSHFAHLECVDRRKKALFRKVNELIRLH